MRHRAFGLPETGLRTRPDPGRDINPDTHPDGGLDAHIESGIDMGSLSPAPSHARPPARPQSLPPEILRPEIPQSVQAKAGPDRAEIRTTVWAGVSAETDAGTEAGTSPRAGAALLPVLAPLPAPVAMILTDLICLAGAAGVLALSGGWPADPLALQILAFAGLAWLALNALAGLYPGYLLHRHERLRRRSLAALMAAGLAGGAGLLLWARADLAVLALLFIGLTMALQPLPRRILRHLLHCFGLWGLPVEVVGEREAALRLAGYFSRNWDYGLIPHPVPPGSGECAAGGPAAGSTAADAQNGRRIALAAALPGPGSSGGSSGSRPFPTMADLRRIYCRVLVPGDMPGLALPPGLSLTSGPSLTDAPPLPSQTLGGGIALTLRGGQDGARARRVLDLALALPLMLIALPIIGLAALILRRIDPGPALYRQPREGLNGRVIEVLKLRTMYRDAEARLTDVLARDPVARQQWATHFKLENDPRILPGIGRILRATSLDELPQLLNVIRGEMSLIGPRPFPLYHLEAMDPAFRLHRASITPGLTGLWQVSERSSADLAQQCQLDAFYIENRSFWLDLHILLRTASALFGRSGI